MDIIAKVLLIVFIIVCVLLVLLVAIQGDEQNGMGGLLGGRSTAAFGSHSASVLTKTTGVLVAMFFVLALSLALVNSKKGSDVINDLQAVEATTGEATSENWTDNLMESSETETTEAEAEAAETETETVDAE